MAWPRKIGLFGRGSGRQEPMPMAEVLKRKHQQTQNDEKRRFIRSAVLAQLQAEPPTDMIAPSFMVKRAYDLWDEIEARI